MLRDGVSIFIAGVALMGVSGLLDFSFRVRLWRAGEKRIFRMRGGYDYQRYRREAMQRGWPVWPLQVMVATLALGIALFAIGLFVIYGAGRLRPN